MRITRRLSWAVVLAVVAVAWPAGAGAQDLIREALSSFPAATVRVEYSSPERLRTLPNYTALSHRYEGPRLLTLENSLAQLGVRIEDINELVTGWQARGGGGGAYDLSGLAQGRFDAQGVAKNAAAQGLVPTPLGNASAYCLSSGDNGNCVVILGDSLGAFGTLESLSTMLKARAGEVPSAGSDASFAKRVENARTDAPIWGVAVGPAVADWFRGWMPTQQGNLQLDLKQTFQNVEALSYSVQATDKVTLDVKMDCKTSQDAGNLRQLMQGLKLFQQMSWQQQNPNLPNPFQTLEVKLDDRQVHMNIQTAYAELEAARLPGKS